jgi:hypothetical protein
MLPSPIHDAEDKIILPVLYRDFVSHPKGITHAYWGCWRTKRRGDCLDRKERVQKISMRNIVNFIFQQCTTHGKDEKYYKFLILKPE